jgi:hypothetical protein
MKYLFLLLFLFLFGLFSNGQGLSELSIPGIDTIRTPQFGRPESVLSVPSVSSELPFFLINAPLKIEAPAFDISRYLNNNWKIESQYSINSGINPFRSYSGPFSPLPFYHSGTVFNQAVYRINDKMSLGGNSFGVNSIFTAPLPHPGRNQWETRGASMFMEYKVNKNIRIETRISVSGSPNYP